ncbi:TIGR04282 family arsenosugar biosynthesis glycosyltransferase [Mastigocoleus sp. MO_188.B34]|uniref:TIGR04282 family arsenosugar biosynthesis glycosyltransferase n=1 Tax=Mastigocoleus sp. MO_188.B34 TaxID=3036635 RepID=UPI002630CA33|nr:TIGR04282 family arsenosugar biosynthesis glycosyltransferase [Mastigocoleus sp. MO_188.B34]MDJ0696175.1 TIGR04282 family arsenosugar biosynthesis glycosyltransferase [Mastigocoleus sp. MO_188.B34]
MQKPPKIMQQHLIIFSRYPEAGKTKTRLIPTLGPQGAANLQRQMTEYILSKAKQLQNQILVSLEIRFAGGNTQLMKDWLGSDIAYQAQGEGDLGMRMARSLSEAFQNGAEKSIIIGTDCPSIELEILKLAFEYLTDKDLVLGRAIDGGYYLIALRRSIPELFVDVDWGTDKVFQQTVNIAKRLNLAVDNLPTLADIDRPEDLEIWEEIHRQRGKNVNNING